jgi:undecaprenyl phosphate-alpha-L-ara4N flippase subunit ArnE
MTIIAVLAIAITILIETMEQLAFKGAAKFGAYRKYLLGLGIALHVCQLLSWFFVLTLLPLGIAAPLMGATYVTIAIGSRFVFGEKIDRRRAMGIAAIVIGLALISRSDI